MIVHGEAHPLAFAKPDQRGRNRAVDGNCVAAPAVNDEVASGDRQVDVWARERPEALGGCTVADGLRPGRVKPRGAQRSCAPAGKECASIDGEHVFPSRFTARKGRKVFAEKMGSGGAAPQEQLEAGALALLRLLLSSAPVLPAVARHHLTLHLAVGALAAAAHFLVLLVALAALLGLTMLGMGVGSCSRGSRCGGGEGRGYKNHHFKSPEFECTRVFKTSGELWRWGGDFEQDAGERAFEPWLGRGLKNAVGFDGRNIAGGER